MQLYSGMSAHFVKQAIGNQIAYALADNFRRYFGYTPSDSEVKSWNNSLRDMAYVIRDAQLGESGVMVEYRLPMSSKRLDVMVTGNGFDDQQRAVIVELKQWDRAYKCGIEDCVTWAPTDHSPHLHPSRQAGSYAEYLQGAHTAFYSDTGDDFVHLNACSFLHNANSRACGDLFDAEYTPTLEQYPLFTGDMKETLQEYLFERVGAGDGRNVLARVLQSRYLPSRRLLDHIAAMVEGNPIYQLLDEQLIAFNTVISKIRQFQQQAGKAVVMVRGAPGTGKSVIAMRIISEMAKEGRNVVHCTGSKAFTTNLRAQVGSRASVAFKYTTSFVEEEPNTLDVLVVDEAHRIREKSDVWYLPKKGVGPQVDEMVDVAKVSVFLLDENQVVRPGEVGTPRLIRDAAQRKKTEFFEFELEGQFRCSGSEGYLRWLDHVLGLGGELDRSWKQDFEFRILDTPQALESEILAQVAGGATARLVAGFCWPWSDPRPDQSLVNDVIIGDWNRPWNRKAKSQQTPKNDPYTIWAMNDQVGIRQIGCIYSAQGFEFDYVGVIFGNDLVWDESQGVWRGITTNSYDNVVKRSRDFTQHLANTYRVLLSRGMKGVYTYFLDAATRQHFESLL